MTKDLDFDPFEDEFVQLVKDPNSGEHIFKFKILDVEMPQEEFKLTAYLDDPEDKFNVDIIEPSGISSLQNISDKIVKELTETDKEKVDEGNFEDLSISYDKAYILQTAAHLGEKWNSFLTKNRRMEDMFFEEIDTLIGLSMLFGKELGSYNTKRERDFFYKKGIKYHKLNERQSKAGKFNKSRYYDEVIVLAEATWERYPEASVSAMAEKISQLLAEKYPQKLDLPAKTTIEKTWLYNADFRPNIRSKRTLQFSLLVE